MAFPSKSGSLVCIKALTVVSLAAAFVCVQEMRADFWMLDNLCTPGVCVTQTFCNLEKSCPKQDVDTPCNAYWLEGNNHLVCQVDPGQACKAKGVSVVCTQPKKCKCKYNAEMEKVCGDDTPDNGSPNWKDLCSI